MPHLTAAAENTDMTVWAWIAGAALLFCVHFVIHPLARLFRHSLLVLQQRKLPLFIVMLLQGVAWYAYAHHFPGLPEDPAAHAPHFAAWPDALLASLGAAVKRASWALHSVAYSGALFLVCPLQLMLGIFFVSKTGETVSTRQKLVASSVLGAALVFSAFGVALVLGWLPCPDGLRAVIRALLGGCAMAWVQVWFCRGIADPADPVHPFLYTGAETSRRWDRIMLLGLLYAPMLWLSESPLPELRLVADWVVPEFLIIFCMLPMMVASTRYSFIESGGAAVLLLKSIWLPVSGLLISAITGFTLAEYATRVAAVLLHDSKPVLEAVIVITVRSLLQCWLSVCCGLLLLRSGYLRPVRPSS